MAKEPLPEDIESAIAALEKYQRRVKETRHELTQAIRLARREDRITRKQADAIDKTYAE